jgi:hypothetical protein
MKKVPTASPQVRTSLALAVMEPPYGIEPQTFSLPSKSRRVDRGHDIV